MSGVSFGNVVGAIDGLLIYIQKPTFYECREVSGGKGQFKYHRKDKYGFNMQAMYDQKPFFWWIDIKWPGSTSDYMDWITTTLCQTCKVMRKQRSCFQEKNIGENT